MELKISLGGRDISELVQGSVRLKQSAEFGGSKASLSLRFEAESLKMLDWSQWVEVSQVGAPGRAILFSGLVERASPGGDAVDLSLSDPSVILNESRTGGGFGSGVNPSEILYYMLAVATPEMTDPQGIPYGDGSSLADHKWLFAPRMYSFVAPLPFVNAPATSIDFLDGVIYAGSPMASYDEKAIASFKFKKPVEVWGEGVARIRFVLQAEGFLDAFEKGRERLRKALDVMALAANSVSAVLPLSKGEPLSFSRDRLNIDVREPDWLFVRDNFPGRVGRHWLRWYAPHLQGGGLSVSDDHFRRFNEFSVSLATKSPRLLSARERSLLNAAHALRRSRQSVYEADALSLLWQVVEFLVAGFPAAPPVSKATAAGLLRRGIEELRILEKDATPQHLAEMEKHLRRGLNQVRSLPLRDKWRALCQDFGLDFTEEEDELMWGLRTARNDELHGKGAAVKRTDVVRVLGMIEKAVLAGIQRAQP